VAKPQQILTLLESALAERCFSGCQLYAENGHGTLSLSLGKASYWDPQTPVDEKTLFDIGSVTKVVFTTTALAIAVNENRLSLSETLGDVSLELKKSPAAAVTCEQLLNHCGGMVWWHALHLETVNNLQDWFSKNISKLFVEKPGVKSVYSDPGFWALSYFIDKVFPEYHGDWRRLFAEKIAGPLKLKEVQFGPVDTARAAATEFQEKRGGVVRGSVFDENCASLGGVGTHAGLFSSAAELAPFARAWLSAVQGKGGWLKQEVAQRFTQKTGPVKNASWALGWDSKSPSGSTAGDRFSLSSFGSLGFPGCSLWIDPEQNGFVIFFTNRVHPSRYDDRIRTIRPRLHDAVSDYWHGNGSGKETT